MLPVLTALCGRFSLGTYEQATRVARIVRWDGPHDFVVLEAGDARLRVTSRGAHWSRAACAWRFMQRCY